MGKLMEKVPYILAAFAAINGVGGLVAVVIFEGDFNLHTLTITEILIMSLFLCLFSILMLMFVDLSKDIQKAIEKIEK
jgi:hypothetical protein